MTRPFGNTTITFVSVTEDPTVLDWRDPRNWSISCESRLLVRALAAYRAGGWSAGLVSGLEFDGQGGGSGDSDHRRPRSWSGAAQVGHALGHHGQRLGEFEPG